MAQQPLRTPTVVTSKQHVGHVEGKLEQGGGRKSSDNGRRERTNDGLGEPAEVLGLNVTVTMPSSSDQAHPLFGTWVPMAGLMSCHIGRRPISTWDSPLVSPTTLIINHFSHSKTPPVPPQSCPFSMFGDAFRWSRWLVVVVRCCPCPSQRHSHAACLSFWAHTSEVASLQFYWSRPLAPTH